MYQKYIKKVLSIFLLLSVITQLMPYRVFAINIDLIEPFTFHKDYGSNIIEIKAPIWNVKIEGATPPESLVYNGQQYSLVGDLVKNRKEYQDTSDFIEYKKFHPQGRLAHRPNNGNIGNKPPDETIRDSAMWNGTNFNKADINEGTCNSKVIETGEKNFEAYYETEDMPVSYKGSVRVKNENVGGIRNPSPPKDGYYIWKKVGAEQYKCTTDFYGSVYAGNASQAEIRKAINDKKLVKGKRYFVTESYQMGMLEGKLYKTYFVWQYKKAVAPPIDGTLNADKKSITINSNDSNADINVTIEGTISSNIPSFKAENVQDIQANINGYKIDNIEQKFSAISKRESETLNISNSATITIPRKNLKIGSNTINIRGMVSYLSTLGGEYISKEVSDTVTINVISTVDSEPQVIASSPATQKTSENLTIPVEVKGTIFNYNVGNNPKITKLTLKLNRILPTGFPEEKSSYEKEELYNEDGEKTSIQHTFKIDVPAKNREFTQEFKAVIKVDFSNGISKTAEGKCFTKIIKDEPITPPIITPPTNKPPVATINAPITVLMGNDINISGSGTDPDGDELTYSWEYGQDLHNSNLDDENSISNEEETVWFSKVGEEELGFKVKDPEGLSDIARKTIKVLPPIPNVILDYNGKLKVNRKVTINSTGTINSKRYPLEREKTTWEIEALSGLTLSDIKTLLPYEITKNAKGIDVLRITGDYNSIDILSKKAGQISVTCSMVNTAEYSGFATKTIVIQPDLPPIAKFTAEKRVIRDPNDLSPNGKPQFTITINDLSNSPDNDLISKRAYVIVFDTNEDSMFDNEMSYLYEPTYNGSGQIKKDDSLNPHLRPIGLYKDTKKNFDIDKLNTGNLSEIVIKSTLVGKMLVANVVEENIPESETIPQFISDIDKLKGNTFE